MRDRELAGEGLSAIVTVDREAAQILGVRVPPPGERLGLGFNVTMRSRHSFFFLGGDRGSKTAEGIDLALRSTVLRPGGPPRACPSRSVYSRMSGE